MAYALNLADLAFTLLALRLGCREGNPLMASVPVLVGYKLVVVGLLLAWLARRREKLARTGLQICTAVYTVLDLSHIVCLILIGGMRWFP